jgi:hypothetical protein
MLERRMLPPLEVYASGGDSITPRAMLGELERVAALGIRSFKIRGRAHQVDKVAWTQRAAATAGIGVAVDMTQNLVVPSQSPRDVLEFTQRVVDASGVLPLLLEEVLGAGSHRRAAGASGRVIRADRRR